MQDIDPKTIERLRTLTTPRLNKFIPHTPSAKQSAYMLLPQLEGLYGGAAGGGKSDVLLMLALQYVDKYPTNSLILRTSAQDLKLPSGLIPRAKEWLAPFRKRTGGTGEVSWNGSEMTFTFHKTGAVVQFGYLKNPDDKFRYGSSEYQTLLFEELCEFPREADYTYLFSRVRRNKGMANMPLRIRSSANPIGPGFEWVRQRFIIEDADRRVFLPAGLDDNPHIDAQTYRESLAEMDEIERKKIEDGDWSDLTKGDVFEPEAWEYADNPAQIIFKCRSWDFAATEPHAGNKDPDWLAGVLLGLDSNGRWWLLDMQRTRLGPDGVERFIKRVAREDGSSVPIAIEVEGGSQAKIAANYYKTQVLVGFDVHVNPARGSKTDRARPLASQQRSGNLIMLRADWNGPVRNEFKAFPEGGHDDIVDAAAHGFNWMVEHKRKYVRRANYNPHAPSIR